MKYEPENLNRWTLPDCYAGAKWPEYFRSGCGRSRDSGSLERSNFECMLRALGGESATVIVVRESHWAVGWVEWIAIHESDERALKIADEIAAGLEDYPVVDESHWGELEWEEAATYWEELSPREKVQHAIDERKRYHWLQSESVWKFGRWDWHTLANSDSTIANAVYERVRTYASE